MSAAIKISKDLALPLDVAGEAIAILATRGAGKSFTSAVLIEELYRSDVQTVTIDPTGVYWGLRSDAKGKGDGLPIIVLGGAHGDVPLQETAGKLIADLVVDTTQSMVLDLSDFDSDGAQCRFMTDFAERLYRRKARSRSTLHLVVDEADEFAPQQPQAKEARMVGAMAKLVRRGRSRGIGMTMITQRSAALNKNLLDLVDTLLLMRMLGPRDRDAAAGWIKHNKLSDDLGVLDSLPSLPTGTAWVWSPLRGILQKAAMRRIETFDSYVTPKPGEVRVEPKVLAKVNIEKLGEQIKATAERARSDDPVALRNEIAMLKQQLTKKTPSTESEIEDARDEGYVNGYATALAHFRDLVTNAGARAELLVKDMHAIDEILAQAKKRASNGPRPENPGTGSKPRLPRVASNGADRVETTSTSTARQLNGAGSSEIGNSGLRKIMVALAQQSPNGLTTKQIGVRACMSSSSGTFSTYLSKARASGWIDGKNPDIRITPGGMAALGTFEPLPKGQELLQYWLGQLGNSGASRILSAVAQAYPESMSMADVAKTANLAESGTFSTYVSKLRSLQLVSGRGELTASPDLF